MMKNKTKYPLIKRVPRELKGDWSKYLLVSLFMIFVIGFIAGMYVANESMLTAARKYDGDISYRLENDVLTLCVILKK